MSVNAVNSDGSLSKIAGGINTNDADIIKSDLSYVELYNTATVAHAQGDCFVMNTGQLVRATSAINIGDTITLNTNVSAVSIVELLADKVDKVAGKDLSTNDYNDTDKAKVGKIDETITHVSDNPISISGLKSNQLAVNPVITFEPIQAGSGTPSPSNIRAISGYDKIEVLSCGKNLINCLAGNSTPSDTTSSNATKRTFVPNTWVVGLSYNNYYYPTNVTNVSKLEGGISGTSAGIYGVGYVLKLKKGATYSLSYTVGSNTNIRTIYYGKDGTWLGQYVNDTFTVGNETEYVVIVIYANSNDFSVTNLQLEENTESTAYVPYNKTTDLSESLGQTVYGGSLDVRSGKFTVTHKIVDMGDLIYSYYDTVSNNPVFQTVSVTDRLSGANLHPYICECYDSLTLRGTNNTVSNLNIYDTSTNIYVTDNRYTPDNTGATNLKTALSGVKLCYELKDSSKFTIQLTPHEISLLKDYAYVSTNGTSIALDYHNGEIATLGDVSQLGETVNELGSLISKTDFGTRISLETYSQVKPYVTPCDGYVVVYSNGNGIALVNIAGTNEVQDVNTDFSFGIFTAQSGVGQGNSIYVKKGMKLSINTLGSGSTARFYPLNG